MGILKKGNGEHAKDMPEASEKEREKLEKKKREELARKNAYEDMEREIDKIQEECELLREKNRRRWKKVGVLCGVFLLLGIAANVGLCVYNAFGKEKYIQELEQEYTTKRSDILEKLGME